MYFILFTLQSWLKGFFSYHGSLFPQLLSLPLLEKEEEPYQEKDMLFMVVVLLFNFRNNSWIYRKSFDFQGLHFNEEKPTNFKRILFLLFLIKNLSLGVHLDLHSKQELPFIYWYDG